MKGSSLQYRQRLTEWCMCACVRVQPLLVREPSFINMYILLIFLCFSGRKKRRKKKSIRGVLHHFLHCKVYSNFIKGAMHLCECFLLYFVSRMCGYIYVHHLFFFSFFFTLLLPLMFKKNKQNIWSI